MQLDLEFSVGCIGALASGEAVASPPAAARSIPHPKPHVGDRDELQSDQARLFGSLRMLSQFLR
jgi:hypothetical protein